MVTALVKKIILSNPQCAKKTVALFSNAIRNHWNYQYKPGPYPKTAEERAAAAKKYGLSIEEYKPYPEEMGYGDYPKMPDIGFDSKDPAYPYDNPEMRRNFNEPMHARSELFGGDRYDPGMRPRFSRAHQWTWFLGVVGGTMIMFLYMEDYKFGRPVTAKQYPGQGTHYLFETK